MRKWPSWRKTTTRRVMTYGIDTADADVRAVDVSQHGARCISTCCCPGATRRCRCTLNLPGRHNVLNALAASRDRLAARRRGRGDARARWRSSRASAGVSIAAARLPSTRAASCWSMTTAITRANSPPYSRPRAAAGRSAGWCVAFQPHRYTPHARSAGRLRERAGRGRRAGADRSLSGRRGADRRAPTVARWRARCVLAARSIRC